MIFRRRFADGAVPPLRSSSPCKSRVVHSNVDWQDS